MSNEIIMGVLILSGTVLYKSKSNLKLHLRHHQKGHLVQVLRLGHSIHHSVAVQVQCQIRLFSPNALTQLRFFKCIFKEKLYYL